jgi:NAD(P)-dependent dehydrogenase (short-subunit alcohol dehydrogenase family)
MMTKTSAATEGGDARDLSGRVAIVTGGGQGIGRRYALSLARAGAIPVIAEINAATARDVEAEIRAAGGRALALELDVSDYAACERMAAAVAREFGRIDVLVNNAAIFSSLNQTPFDAIPLAEWDAVLRVNVTGTYYCSRAVFPIMRDAGWGRIINVSTSAVALGGPGYLHYTTSKSALLGMTNSLAREAGKFGITVNCIVPGATETEIPRASFNAQVAANVAGRQCIPRTETPDDIVGLVLFLSSPASDFITGQTIAVNGGLTHTHA